MGEYTNNTLDIGSPTNPMVGPNDLDALVSLQGGSPMFDEPEGPMTDEDVQNILRAEIDDAVQYMDNVDAPMRATATKYYRGEFFGDEEDGRSKYVSMDVQDVVQAFMPQLMRCFMGTLHVAEFVPTKQGGEELAKQATEYIDYIVRNESNGFSELYAAMKDALIRRIGILKWWVEEKKTVSQSVEKNLTEEQLAILLQELDTQDATADVTQNNGDGTVDVTVTRRKTAKKFRIAAVPPEEFVRSRDAKSIEEARFVGHRRDLTVSDLVAMGYDEELIEEHLSNGLSPLELNQEVIERNPDAQLFRGLTESKDPSQRKVEYVEGYLLVDQDGDGIAELRKICTIGGERFILSNEIVDERPFANLCPDPEPHTFDGLSVTDVVADIQRVKSAILRNMLDSLAGAIHPRLVVVDNAVNMSDVRNTEVGAVIRARVPGMVQPLQQPFAGKEAFPMLDYFEQVKTQRTGKTDTAGGLDPSVFQSTTDAAVAATVQASQQRIELIARIFAETGIKRMYKGLLRLVCSERPKARVIRLRGKWVDVDPASWDADMDVQVQVAVGTATIEARKATLQKIAELQGTILSTYGLSNPLVSLAQYRYTLAQMIEAEGLRSPDMFFNEIDPNWQPPPQPQQGQTSADRAAELLANAQAEETRQNTWIKKQELELKKQQMINDYDLKQDQLIADVFIRAAEIEAKSNTHVDVARIKAEIQARHNPPAEPTAEPVNG